MRFCAHSVGSHAAALVDEMTAPDVTSSPDRNDRADRHERIDIIEEIQNARVWAAVLQQHIVPSPLRARCHNRIARQFVPVARLTNHVSMLRSGDSAGSMSAWYQLYTRAKAAVALPPGPERIAALQAAKIVDRKKQRLDSCSRLGTRGDWGGEQVRNRVHQCSTFDWFADGWRAWPLGERWCLRVSRVEHEWN